jgi:hypothetical protein
MLARLRNEAGAYPEKLEANVNTKALAISAALASLLVTGCAVETRGGGVGVGVGVSDYYDGYYDGYYGPFNDGYWGDDGAFYYADSGRNWHRDDGRHFRRDAYTGYSHVHGSGAHREH